MKVAGIVAEYNPLHSGHIYHMEQTRRALGEDTAIVCCISGDFVQRGEAAVYSKFARAEAAARCGADLVFELPLPWALASAEGFARGGVGLLGALGIVDCLSFGSECGRAEPLERLARELLDPKLGSAIRAELQEGKSYAAARQAALAGVVGEDLAALLEQPNNILAVEYIKALYELRIEMDIMTMPRCGAAHDSREGEGSFRSASELRTRIAVGESANAFIPAAAGEVFDRERDMGRGPVVMYALESALLSRLRMLPDTAWEKLPDASEGLYNRLREAVNEEASWDGVVSATKSKRYALSRIRRMCMCACLGVTEGMADGVPPYARLLAATDKGRELLREIQRRGSIPVITKPATVRELPKEAQSVFELGAKARDLWTLACPARAERRPNTDWRTGPAILK